MKHTKHILVEVQLDDSWDDYFEPDKSELSVDPKLLIEDLFPFERRMDGVTNIKYVESQNRSIMNKILGIKGDRNRGNEVIALLQMLGGEAVAAKGYDEAAIYVIPVNGIIDVRYNYEKRIENYAVFTLDEFYARFPFKVGDFVFADSWRSAIDIREMRWNPDSQKIEYMVKPGTSEIWYTADNLTRYTLPKFHIGETVYNRHTHKFGEIVKYQLQKDEYIYFMEDAWYLERQLTNDVKPANNENKMKNVLAELLEHIKTTPKEDLEREFEEIAEWSNVGPTVEEFMTFCECVNKKPKYPTTYERCCEVLFNDKSYAEYIFIPAKVCTSYHKGDFITELPFEIEPYETTIRNFYKLLICRDAYWKLADNWKPDWKNTKNVKYGIAFHDDTITKMYLRNENVILAFPTEEMRDAFYENFKELIDKCKELL